MVDRSISGGVTVMGAVDAAPMAQARVLNKAVALTTSAQDITLPSGIWRYVEWSVNDDGTRVAITVNETAALGSGSISDGTTNTWKPGASKTGVNGALHPTTPLTGGTDVLNGIASAGTTIEMVLYKDAP